MITTRWPPKAYSWRCSPLYFYCFPIYTVAPSVTSSIKCHSKAFLMPPPLAQCVGKTQQCILGVYLSTCVCIPGHRGYASCGLWWLHCHSHSRACPIFGHLSNLPLACIEIGDNFFFPSLRPSLTPSFPSSLLLPPPSLSPAPSLSLFLPLPLPLLT